VARRRSDSTPSSPFIDLVAMECRTLQMTWIGFGTNKRLCTDLKTPCTVLSQVEMAWMTQNQHTNTRKLTEEVTPISTCKTLNNHPWKWLAKTRSPSPKDKGLMKMRMRPSRKWISLKAKPRSRKTSSDNSTQHPKWARDLSPKVSFPNSSPRERNKQPMQLLKDFHKCLRDLHSKIN